MDGIIFAPFRRLKGNWRTTKVGDTTTHPDTGETMKWCQHHGKTGCYMPEDHNHEAWAKQKEANGKRRGQQSPANPSSPKNLKLSAKHRAALTTSLTTSFAFTDEEAAQFIKDEIESSKD